MVSITERSQLRGVKSKIVERSSTNGVKWEGTLKQKGVKQRGVQEGLDVVGNMALVSTSSHSRKNFSEKYLHFGYAPTVSFVIHVLGQKILKHIRLNGAPNYLPARGAHPTVSVSHLQSNRLVCFHTLLFCCLYIGNSLPFLVSYLSFVASSAFTSSHAVRTSLMI